MFSTQTETLQLPEITIRSTDIFSAVKKRSKQPEVSVENFTYEWYSTLNPTDHWAEKQIDKSFIFIDLDIYMPESKPVCKDDLEKVCKMIYDGINEISDKKLNSSVWFAILHKRESDDSLPLKDDVYKDGIHILVSCYADRQFKYALIQHLKEPITDFIAKNYDVSETKRDCILDANCAHVCCFPIGQCKPGGKLHQLAYVMTVLNGNLSYDNTFVTRAKTNEINPTAEFSILPWDNKFRKHVRPFAVDLNAKQRRLNIAENVLKLDKVNAKREMYSFEMEDLAEELQSNSKLKQLLVKLLRQIVINLDDRMAGKRSNGGSWVFVLSAIKHICEVCKIKKEDALKVVVAFSELNAEAYKDEEDCERSYDAITPNYSLDTLLRILQKQNPKAFTLVTQCLNAFEAYANNVDERLRKLKQKYNHTILSEEEVGMLKTEMTKIINRKYCFITDTSKPCVISWTMAEIKKQFYRVYCYQSARSLVEVFSNREITYRPESEKKKVKTAVLNPISVWMKHESRKQHRRVVFLPEGNTNDYNYFHGLACLQDSEIPPLTEDHPWFQHILNRACNGNKVHYDYLLNIFASWIQHPGEKTPAPVFLGEEGAGKGMIVKPISKIIGRDYFVHLQNSTSLTGSFNGIIEHALLVFADEAFWGGDKKSEGILRGLLTEDSVVVNQKYVSEIQVGNYMNFVMASNMKWVVPATKNSRRFFVLNFSNEMAGSHGRYSAALKAEQKEIINVPIDRLAQFFYARDLSKFDPRDIPITNALRDQKVLSFDKVTKFWYNIIDQGYSEELNLDLRNPKPIRKDLIYECYHKSMKDDYVKEAQFWKESRQIFDLKEIRPHGKKRYIVFESLEKTRDEFRKWMDDEHWLFSEEYCDDSECNPETDDFDDFEDFRFWDRK